MSRTPCWSRCHSLLVVGLFAGSLCWTTDVYAQSASQDCELLWSELMVEESIPLISSGSAESVTTSEDCVLPTPTDNDQVECKTAEMATGESVTMCTDGPAGSGRFWTWTIAVGDDQRVACGMASTAGWRHIYVVVDETDLAPLPWLADLDGNGETEVVLWYSLPFGSASMAEQGLWPVAYRVSKDRSQLVLSPEPDLSIKHRVSESYRALAAQTGNACHSAMARALDDPHQR